MILRCLVYAWFVFVCCVSLSPYERPAQTMKQFLRSLNQEARRKCSLVNPAIFTNFFNIYDTTPSGTWSKQLQAGWSCAYIKQRIEIFVKFIQIISQNEAGVCCKKQVVHCCMNENDSALLFFLWMKSFQQVIPLEIMRSCSWISRLVY